MNLALDRSTLSHPPVSSPTNAPGPEQRICIVCRGSLDQLAVNTFDTRFGINGKYDVWRCSRCQLEQMFPVPTLAELKNLYESHYNFGGEKGTLYTALREWFFSSFLYRAWIQFDGDLSFHACKGKGRLIDIGCNEGRGLKIYARNGFQVEGSELNETAAAQARGRGYIVHTKPIGAMAPGVPYDVAVLSNVLEHALDPRQMLLEVRRLLAVKGQLWISCPNNQSWLRSVFGKYWINWHVPFHISHFSPQTIARLLGETGFTSIEIRQVTPALWVAMSIIARTCAKEGRPSWEMRNPVLLVSLLLFIRVLMFPVIWLKNCEGRGDCLLVTAVKS